MAASMMARSSAATQRSAFFGSKATKAPVLVAKAPRAQVATQALFGFGAKKESASAGATPSYYICTACGFIYDGDFKTAPSSYKCPVCNVPKSKFKVYKGVIKGRPNNGSAAIAKRFQEKQW